MSEDPRTIFLSEKEGKNGKFYSRNLGTKEDKNYLTCNVDEASGELSVRFEGKTSKHEAKTNDYGNFWEVDVLSGSFYVNPGASKWGPYLRFKEKEEVPEGADSPPARRESYGDRADG